MRKKGRICICLLVTIAIFGAQSRGAVGEFPYPILPEKFLNYSDWHSVSDDDSNIVLPFPGEILGKGRTYKWRNNNEYHLSQDIDYPQNDFGNYWSSARIISRFKEDDFVPQYLIGSGSWTKLNIEKNMFLKTERIRKNKTSYEDLTTIYSLPNFEKIGEVPGYDLDDIHILSNKYGYASEGLGDTFLIDLKNGEKLMDIYKTLGGFSIWKNLFFGDKAVFDIETGKTTKPFMKDFAGGVAYICGDTVIYVDQHDIELDKNYSRYKIQITRLSLPDFTLIDKAAYVTDFYIQNCFGKDGKYCECKDFHSKKPIGEHILETMTGEIVYKIPKNIFYGITENGQLKILVNDCMVIYDLDRKEIVKRIALGSNVYAQGNKLYLVENEVTKDGATNNIYETNEKLEKTKYVTNIGKFDRITHIDGDKVAYFARDYESFDKICTNVKNEKGEFVQHTFNENTDWQENGRYYIVNFNYKSIDVGNVFLEKPEKSIPLPNDTFHCEVVNAKYPWMIINLFRNKGPMISSIIYNLEKLTSLNIDPMHFRKVTKIISDKVYIQIDEHDDKYLSTIYDLTTGKKENIDIGFLEVNENQIVGLKKVVNKETGKAHNKIEVYDRNTLQLKESHDNPHNFISLYSKFGKWYYYIYYSSQYALDSDLNPIQEITGMPITNNGFFKTFDDNCETIGFPRHNSSIKYNSCASYTLELNGKIFVAEGRQKLTFVFTNNNKSIDTPLDVKFQVVPWGDDGYPLLYTKLSDNWISLPGIEKGEKQAVTVDVSDALIPNPNLLDAAKAGKRLGIVVVANGLMDTLGMEKDPKKTTLTRFDGQPLSYNKQLAVSVTSFEVK